MNDGSKVGNAHVEQVHTNERVPGHANYYEKNGLRTYGDDADHDHEPKMSFARMMSLVAMAFRTPLPPTYLVFDQADKVS